MNGHIGRMIFAWILALCSVPALVANGADVGQGPTDADEVKAVFRISKAYLDDVTDRKIVANIPLHATVLKFRCTGTIHGEGRIAVAMRDSGQSAVFEVTSHGSGSVCVTGVRGPLVAIGRAWGPFSTSTMVRFDGRRFSRLETTPHVTVHADVQRVTGRHDRRVGRMIGAGILPLTDKLIPKAVAQATPIANRYLQDFVEQTADKIIARLNEKTPVEATVNRLFPKTKDWVFQMSSDETFMQAAYGPPGVPPPALPRLQTDIDDIRLEVWLRSSDEEAKTLADLSQLPLARQLVQRYLEATLPELAALAEERTVDSAGDWVVIRIGTPASN